MNTSSNSRYAAKWPTNSLFRIMQNAAVFLLTGAALLAAGCVSSIGPGGAAPGLFHSNVSYPNSLNPGMEYRIVFEREDIELIGPVEAQASSRWFFFVVSTGDSGYAQLMDQVRAKGGDGVMNVTIDTKYQSYLLFYAKVTTRLTGMAYRYRRASSEEAAGLNDASDVVKHESGDGENAK